jgi:hypothetical protein
LLSEDDHFVDATSHKVFLIFSYVNSNIFEKKNCDIFNYQVAWIIYFFMIYLFDMHAISVRSNNDKALRYTKHYYLLVRFCINTQFFLFLALGLCSMVQQVVEA